jgi:hypothetical protein
MTSYRRALAVVVVCVGLSAGCLGFLTGTQALEFSANETVVSDAALGETGYQEANNQTVRNVVQVGVAGQQRQVNLTSYLYMYNRSVTANDLNASGFGPLADNASAGGAGDGGDSGENTDVPLGNASSPVSFSVLAMPNARVGGQSVHPLSRISTEGLARRFLSTGNGSVSFEGNRTVASLGDQRTVSTFRFEGSANAGADDSADGTTDAGATDGLVHVASFDAGSDYVIVFAAHPAAFDEQERIDALVAGLEQPAA